MEQPALRVVGVLGQALIYALSIRAVLDGAFYEDLSSAGRFLCYALDAASKADVSAVFLYSYNIVRLVRQAARTKGAFHGKGSLKNYWLTGLLSTHVLVPLY